MVRGLGDSLFPVEWAEWLDTNLPESRGIRRVPGAKLFFPEEMPDVIAGLAVWPRASLAHDTGLPASPPSATELSLGHNVRTQEEVDTVMAEAEKAGATIVKRAAPTFWGGYAGYFQDPDGHLWEVAWNSSMMPES